MRAYNEAAIVAYRTHDLSRLSEVATDRETRKVLALVDLRSSNRLVLESELQSLEVADVQRPGPDLMAVRTRERWRYRDRPLDPGKPQGTVFVSDMTLEYGILQQGAGQWKVDGVRTLSNEFLEPKGFRLAPGRGQGGPEAHDSR